MDAPHVPEPPVLPPVPPFPTTLADDVASGMLDQYDVTNDGSKVRFGERTWKPHAAPTPGEARAFWLEKEVVQLKQSLDRMTNGSAFKSSEYWSHGFHPLTGPPECAGFGDHPLQDRARLSMGQGEVPGHSLGGSGDHHLQDQAVQGGAEPRHDRALHGAASSLHPCHAPGPA